MMKRISGLLFLAVLLVTVFVSTLTAVESDPDAERPHLKKAKEWGELVIAQAIPTEHGLKWPVKFNSTAETNNSIYEGAAGVVLYLLEVYNSTGDKKYLENARSGADHLLGTLEEETDMGFYSGIAGNGYALQETFKVTNKKKYNEGAKKCVGMLISSASRTGDLVSWNDSSDIIIGSAGIGLFLLYAARELNDQSALELAEMAGNQLISVGIPANGGLMWFAGPGSPYNYPNFAHGTAGIAYFLARLYEETGKKKYLDAAIAGGAYLQSVAYTKGNVLKIDAKEGGDIHYYLGWCHGPVGTSRLFYQLFRVTGNKSWLKLLDRCANTIVKSGFPNMEAETYGARFGKCCGAAGIAQFFLDIYLFTHKKEYLDLLNTITDHIHDWVKDVGLEEVFKNRVGHMQGVAGGAVWLLHLDAFEQNKLPLLCLPDSPWTPTSRFDLCVKKIRGAKKKYSQGDEIKLTVKVQNLGDRESTEATVICYLSDENKPISSFPQLVKEINSVALDTIPAGKTRKVKFKTSIPEDAPKGKYYLIVCIDKGRVSGDNLIYNNYRAGKLKISIK